MGSGRTVEPAEDGDAVQRGHEHVLVVHELVQREERELQPVGREEVARRVVAEGPRAAREVEVAGVAQRAEARGHGPDVVDLL